MDKTAKVFDTWATAGRSEEMEKGHGMSVSKFLGSVSFDKPFSFLDIGWAMVGLLEKLHNCPKSKKALE
ncbi:MAG: hypothetical protein CM1200mP23_3460 [Nitrososphaerota archaeon]|nr:MAG: hypothetical protein CM1200mP23_3460 [Nitrososphaerota archaeon]